MPTGRRPQQVADLLRAELASVIQSSARDPRIGFVTLTEVRLSADLKSARVYVSVLGDEAREEEALAALKRAAGFLRRELAERVSLRQMPTLTFQPDPSLRQGARIDSHLSIVSVGEATRADERSLRIPLILGDGEGGTSSLILTIRLDPLMDGDSD